MNHTPTHLQKLKQVLIESGSLTADDIDAFLSAWEPLELKRKEIITCTGDTEKYLYFINEGVQRIYYFDELEREATIIFTYPPSFGGIIDSFMLQKPSAYFYETLTPSSLIRTNYSTIAHLMQTRPAINAMIRQAVTVSMSGVLERLVELQCFSSEEKFRKFMQRSPHMLQLVPHKYLANYLGIDATNFSKLINRIKI